MRLRKPLAGTPYKRLWFVVVIACILGASVPAKAAMSYAGSVLYRPLSRVDSNHDLRIQRPALLPVELQLSLSQRPIQGEGFEPPTSRFRAERSTGLNYP